MRSNYQERWWPASLRAFRFKAFKMLPQAMTDWDPSKSPLLKKAFHPLGSKLYHFGKAQHFVARAQQSAQQHVLATGAAASQQSGPWRKLQNINLFDSFSTTVIVPKGKKTQNVKNHSKSSRLPFGSELYLNVHHEVNLRKFSKNSQKPSWIWPILVSKKIIN